MAKNYVLSYRWNIFRYKDVILNIN